MSSISAKIVLLHPFPRILLTRVQILRSAGALVGFAGASNSEVEHPDPPATSLFLARCVSSRLASRSLPLVCLRGGEDGPMLVVLDRGLFETPEKSEFASLDELDEETESNGGFTFA